MKHTQLAPQETISKTIASLKKNGITAEIVQTAEEAKKKISELIPQQAEVMTMTSITLAETGIEELINNSGNYTSVKEKLSSMSRETQNKQMQEIGAAPEWAIGSVHAVTEDGKVVIASNTGSQLPAYLYGSPHVIWVVGTQKIVKDLDEAMQRLNEHVIPLESERARQAYGLPEDWNSYDSKVAIVQREVNPDRIHLIFVNQQLGF